MRGIIQLEHHLIKLKNYMKLFRSNQQPNPDSHQITAANAYMYSPATPRRRLSEGLKRFWNDRPRPQQALLLVAVMTIVVSVVLVGLSFSASRNGSSTRTTQGTLINRQTASQNDAQGNATQNETVDETDSAAVNEDDVSWWQKLLNTVSDKTNPGTSSDQSSDSSVSDEGEEQYDGADEGGAAEDTTAINPSLPNVSRPTTAATSGPKMPFTVATYNIRITSLNSWDSARANAILKYIESTDVVGLQEVKKDSGDWLTSRLKPAGYSRTTRTDRSEDRVIFWRDSTFSLVAQGNKSLSHDRNLVWVRLKKTSSGKEFYFLTTHLRLGNGTSSYSSLRGIEINEILQYIASNITTAPVVFVGDMNSRPGSREDKMIQSGGFKDAYDIAETKINLSYATSVSNFSGGLSGTINTNGKSRIDHIYVKSGVSVNRVEIVKQKGSDHLPVEADVSLTN